MIASGSSNDRIGLHDLCTCGEGQKRVLAVRDTDAQTRSGIALTPLNPVGGSGELARPTRHKDTIAISNPIESNEEIIHQDPFPAVSRIGDEAHKVNATTHSHEQPFTEGYTLKLHVVPP